jgi:hypothetical protein
MKFLKNKKIDRRTVLRGMGAAVIALPLLQAMGGAERLLGSSNAGQAAAAETGLPKFFMAMCAPNGTLPRWWYPEVTGDGFEHTDFELNKLCLPLAAHKDDLTFIRGLDNMATEFTSGCGDNHATAVLSWLTGRRPKKLADQKWDPAGPSLDRFLGEHIGRTTRLPALNCGTQGEGTYSALSSIGPNRFSSVAQSPKEVWSRLFNVVSLDEREAEIQRRRRGSVLDGVKDDYRRLVPKISTADKQRVDQHLSSIRDVEQRIQIISECDPPQTNADGTRYDEIGRFGTNSYERIDEVYRAQLDLIVIAMSCDLTRVATMMFQHGGGGSTFFPNLGLAGDPSSDRQYEFHELSHKNYNSSSYDGYDNGTESADLPPFGQIHRWFSSQLAYFIDRAKATQLSPDGTTLFDQMLVMYGSELSTGYNHRRDELPFMLAGSAGQSLSTGRYLDYRAQQQQHSHNQLLVSISQLMGVDIDSFGSPDLNDGALPNLI